jgi:hypothetical protein
MIQQNVYTGPTVRLKAARLRPVGGATLIAMGVALTVIIGLAGVWAPTRMRQRTELLSPLTPTPVLGANLGACAADQTAAAKRLLEQGQWEEAAALSADELAQLVGCYETRRVLNEIIAAAALEALLAAPASPGDSHAEDARAAQYRALRGQVTALPLTDLQIARRAYDAQQFPLALAAFEQAWQRGTFPRDNRVLVQRYASTLYNRGVWLMQGALPNPEHATALVVASLCLSQQYGLPSDASQAWLTALLGPDPETWPAAYPTPALAGRPCVLGTAGASTLAGR